MEDITYTEVVDRILGLGTKVVVIQYQQQYSGDGIAHSETLLKIGYPRWKTKS